MSWIKGAILALLTAAVVAFGLGFLSFADSVRGAAPPQPLPKADAIVALTGGSQARLEAGVALLKERQAERLLISGVNREVTDTELFDLLSVPRALREKVDLGRAAEDTLGNASETADWARRNNVRRLIVVTDDYHMPRSFAELRLAMPDIELISYPVQTAWVREELWKRDVGAAMRLGGEYVKYLMIRVRESLVAPEPQGERSAPAKQQARAP